MAAFSGNRNFWTSDGHRGIGVSKTDCETLVCLKRGGPNGNFNKNHGGFLGSLFSDRLKGLPIDY